MHSKECNPIYVEQRQQNCNTFYTVLYIAPDITIANPPIKIFFTASAQQCRTRPPIPEVPVTKGDNVRAVISQAEKPSSFEFSVLF
jgi:hypothetical protein